MYRDKRVINQLINWLICLHFDDMVQNDETKKLGKTTSKKNVSILCEI